MSISLRSYPNAYRMLQRMPEDIRRTFTPAQIRTTEIALVPRTHAVDVRFSIPLMGTGAYFVLLAGPNHRNNSRQGPYPTEKGSMHDLRTTNNQKEICSPNAQRLLVRIPPEVRATFTRTQIHAIEAALVPRSHVVDLRLSLPLLGKGSYLALAAGPNRRARYRNLQKRNPFIMPAVFASVLIGAASIFGLVHLKGSKLLDKPDQFTRKRGFHPTAVPFKTNRGECEESGRQWIDDQCIDTIHDPVF
ncbi:MAG: hypothetical protein AAF716_09635 [Cyanobacteria bacterium P01_D01_bin.1]